MISVEKSIYIDRPLDEVFQYVSELANSAQWQSGLSEVHKITPGPVMIGTQYSGFRKFMGRKMEAGVEITEFVPNVRVGLKASAGTIPVETWHQFQSAGQGVNISTKVEMQPSGFAGLAEPLISSTLGHDLAADLGALKSLLENQTAAARTPAAE